MEDTTTEKKTRPGAQRRPRLSRKRYAESVKYLKRVIREAKTDSKEHTARAFRAIELLFGVYDRYDAALERHERAGARAEATQTPETQPEAPAEPVAEDTPVSPEEALKQAQEFLQRIDRKETAHNAE